MGLSRGKTIANSLSSMSQFAKAAKTSPSPRGYLHMKEVLKYKNKQREQHERKPKKLAQEKKLKDSYSLLLRREKR